jgi:hypothetical protein
MGELDFCGVTRQISRFPYESVKTWGILTVRNMLEYQAHVDGCQVCQEIMERVVEEHKDDPPRPDQSSLN